MSNSESLKPNDFGFPILVEDCQTVRINDLLARVEEKTKEMLLNAEFEVLGIPLALAESKTRFGGVRRWFVCPLCSKRVGVLYRHALANGLMCRLCLGADYRTHRV